MRSRPGFTLIIILLPPLALAFLVGAFLARAVSHTWRHLPQVVEAQLSTALDREVRIGRLEGNFIRGLELHDLAIARGKHLADGALVRIKRARVEYDLPSVLGRKVPPVEAIRQVEIDEPWLYLSRDANGRLNLQDLSKPGPPRQGPAPRFLGTVTIRRGTVVFEDHQVPGGRVLTHHLRDLEVRADGRAAPLYIGSVAFRADAGRLARASATVSIDVEQKNVSVAARLEEANLPAWLAYVPRSVKLPAQLEGGRVDVDGTALVLAGKLVDYRGRVSLRDGAVRVPQLRQPVRAVSGAFEVTPDTLVAKDVRLSAGKLALAGEATLLNFKRPWIRARLTTGNVSEADLRALVPNLPTLPNVRMGKVRQLEIAAKGPLSRPETQLNLDLDQVAVKLPVPPAAAEAPAAPAPEVTLADIRLVGRAAGTQRFLVEALTTRVAGGSVTATATVDLSGAAPRYTARGALRGILLESVDLAPFAGGTQPTGRLSADFQVSGTGAQPQGNAQLSLRDASWQEWRVEEAQVAAAFADGILEVRRSQVRAPEALLTAFGSVQLQGPVDLKVAVTEVDVAALGRKLKQEKIGGRVFVQGAVTGTLIDPTFAGEIAAYDLAYGDDRLEMLRGRVSGNLDGIRLEEFRGFMLPAQVSDVTATLTDPRAGADAELEAVGVVTGIDVAQLTRRFQLEGEWGGIVDVEELEIVGPLNALRVNALVTGRYLRGAGRSIDYVSGRVSAGMDGSVEVPEEESLVVRMGNSEARVWGTVSAAQELDIHVATERGKAIHVEDIQPFDPQVLSLASSIGVNLRVTGTVQEPTIRNGEVFIDKLVVNGNAFSRGYGEVQITKQEVRVDRFSLSGGERTATGGEERLELYELNGVVWPRLDLTAKVQLAPIPKLLNLARVPKPAVDVQGLITALIQIKEAEPRPLVSIARLDVTEAAVGPQRIETITAEGIALEADAVDVKRLQVALPDGALLSVHGRASLAEGGPIAFTVNGERLDLALAQAWVPLGKSFGGVGALQAQVGGTLAAPTLTGTVNVEKPRFDRYELDTFLAHLSYADNVARVSKLEARRGDFLLSGAAAVPFDWASKAVPEAAPLDAHIAIEEEKLEDLLAIVGARPSAAPEATARALKTDGILSARIVLGGTAAQPDFRGNITLAGPGEGRGAQVLLVNNGKGGEGDPALRLNGLDAAITFVRDRVQIEHVKIASALLPPKKGRKEAVSNPEALQLTGSITLDKFRPDQFDLKLAANSFEFEERNLSGQFQEYIRFALNTPAEPANPLTITGRWVRDTERPERNQDPRVAGVLQLARAKFDLSRYAAAPAVKEAKTLPVNPALDVRIVTTGEAEVLAARTRALASLSTTLGGNLSAPLIFGDVEVSDGSANLPTAHFKIEEANVAYRMQPPEPFIAAGKALLTTKVRGAATQAQRPETYVVNADVDIDFPAPSGGSPIRMEMTATPFLEEEKIYRLLTRQDVIERLVSGDGQFGSTVKAELMNYMATALQPQLFEPLERAIADRLGLTEFSVSAAFNEPVEVKVGKHLLKGLRVSYTRSVSAREARFKFKVDYEVFDKVSVNWGTDERNSQSLGLEAGFEF